MMNQTWKLPSDKLVLEVLHGYDEQTRRDYLRMNALGSLFFFARWILGKDRLSNNLHRQVCKWLEVEDLHLVLELPMSHYKTTLGTEALSMWWSLPFTEADEIMMRRMGYGDEWIRWMKIAHNPNSRTLVTHDVDSRAIAMGNAIDMHYGSNDVFRATFPEILPDGSQDWNDHTKFQKRAQSTTGEGDLTTGTYEYRGVGSALQGLHVTGVINDDSVGKDAQENMLNGDGRIMENIYRWWKQTSTRFDPQYFTKSGTGRQLVIGNRWGHSDLNSMIKANHPEFRVETHSAEGGCCELHPAGKALFPEEWPMWRLEQQRRLLNSVYDYCLPPNAPILMSDWSEKPIEKIILGDEVVGYVVGEGKNAEKRQERWHLAKAKVIAIGNRQEWILKVTLESGREVACTPGHNWFFSGAYRRVEMGKELISVYTPKPVLSIQEQRDLDWLGGLLDGEGSCNWSTINVAQSENKNPEVCRELEGTCARLGIVMHKNDVKIAPSGKEGYSWDLRGGRSLMIRLIQHARMAKKQRFVKKLWERAGRVSEDDGHDKVVKIELLGQTKVHSIQTETGNYVAYGYASKNSHFYLNLSVLPEEMIFKPEWKRYFRFKQSRPELKLDDQRNSLLLEHEVYGGVAREDVPAGVLHRRMLVDLAHAKKRKRCNHVVLVVGWNPESDMLYILEVFAKKVGYAELVEMIYTIGHRWLMSDMWLETVAAQDLMKFHIEERNRKEKRPIYVNELPYDNSENAKKNRIEALEPLFKNGQVWCHRSQDEFHREYDSYPASATIDVLDTLGYVLQTLGGIRGREAVDFMVGQQERFASREVGVGGY